MNLAEILTNIKTSIARILLKLGISADILTYTGLLLAGVSGYLIFLGEFFWGGVVLLISGILDTLDGAVARLANKADAFGGILDSTLDRFGDAFVLGGLLFYCSFEVYDLYALLAFITLMGSFAISYVRARAECEIDSCRVGFWERGERLVFLALALVLNNVPIALWILAIGSLQTALFRLFYAKKGDIQAYQKGPVFRALFHTQGRRHPAYYVKIGALILTLFLVKISF